TWTGCALLFVMSAQICLALLSVRFPWLASCLLFASMCNVGALVARRTGETETERIFVGPLQLSAMAGAFATAAILVAMLGWRGVEPASLLATYTMLLAAVWLGLLVLSHSPGFFTAFQITLALGAIL